MGRKPVWPPRITTCRQSNRDRCRHRGHTYNLGRAGSAEARAAYVVLVRRLEAEGREGGEPVAGPDGHNGTVAGLAALWYLETLERYGAGNHEVTEHALAMRPVVAIWGASAVRDFDALALERVRDEMVRAGLCRNVVNRRVVRIRTAWRWAERRRIAPPGSWAALRALEPLSPARRDVRRTERVRPVDPVTVERTLGVAPPPLRDLVRLLWHTGARPGELFGLTGAMIDQTGPVWAARLDRHKSSWRGLARTLHFGPQAQAVLRPLLGRHPDAPALVNSRGGAWNRRTADVALRRACARAGVPKWHLYQLRHAWRARVGRLLSVEHARCGMGHTSIDTTLLYGADDDGLAAEAALRAG